MELNNESKTLFIPLYGKAMMSKNNLFINDPKAEEIISKVKFNFEDLKQSKWLSMYMALRAKIIDEICNRYITQNPNTTVIHLGCGLDSRCLRVDNNNISWYDIDFQSVIDLRKQFYKETEKYKMIGKSVTDLSWLDEIDLDNQSVLIVAEGLTMYLSEQELQQLIKGLNSKFSNATIVFDAYSKQAVKGSKIKNPVNQMNANIRVKNQTSTIIGPTKLTGTDVVATDLRAGASLVIAGLMAKGTTKITNVEHILRGYENIVEKLLGVGANLELKDI